MKPARRAVSGVLLLNKPAGISSTAAVGWAKRLFNAAKAGHTGTLDPFATGLLLVCFGEATKYSRFHLAADKRYRATLKLGARSTTGDTEGEPIDPKDVTCSLSDIHAALAAMTGRQCQMPPMHSAVKVAGVPLYKLARKGQTADRPKREIEVYALTVVEWRSPELVIDAHVSKGTYMRVLAEDIGESLGCGAYLVALQRTGSGDLGLDRATTFDTLESLAPEQRDATLLPTPTLALSLPAVSLPAKDAQAFSHGRPVPGPAHPAGTLVRVVDPQGCFLGVATMLQDGDQFRLVPERLMNVMSFESN
ncbi:MAG: tRNA pseudouridine(55) synthase TruB [Betaproteobacteria bacterium]|nr:tRNA pseudouridine(55) synthase TruB [Betaproteobacteria bacterium]